MLERLKKGCQPIDMQNHLHKLNTAGMKQPKQSVQIALVIALCLATATSVCFPPSSIAGSEQSLHIVTLDHSPALITPNPVKAHKGDTITWYTRRTEPVIITFITNLGIVCSPIVNFYANAEGHYETMGIPRGGTASLCFIYEGTYEYTVSEIMKAEKKGPDMTISSGVVIVESPLKRK